jgi:hypothetical protein
VAANKANVARILAAIKQMKQETTQSEREAQAAQRKINAAEATYAARRKELGEEVKAYFNSKHMDPDGCVSDPHDDCLDQLDAIPDAAVRDKFKARLKALQKTRDIAVAGPKTELSNARTRRENAFKAYIDALDDAGEKFASEIGALTGRTGVSVAPVRFNASEVMPDRVYLSTIETGQFKFVANARDFHKAWDLSVTEITSLEELIDDVIRRSQASVTNPIKRIRLLSHGTPTSMRLRMFKDGVLELDEDLFETFLDGTLPLFRTLIGRHGVNERVPAASLAAAIASESGSDQLRQKFPLAPVGQLVAAYLVYEALHETKVYEQSAGWYADLVESTLRAITRVLRKQLVAEGGVTLTDIARLRQALLRALGSAEARAPLATVKFDHIASDDLKAFVEFLGSSANNSIEARIAKFQGKLDSALYLDLRGCELGMSKRLMRASATLFGITPSQVTAPTSFVGFAKAERDLGVSFECDPPSMKVVEDLVEEPGTHQHAPPWRGVNYLRNQARFLGILSYPGGWVFASPDGMTRIEWDDLGPGFKAAEVMCYIPFFSWLAPPFGSTSRAVSELRFYLDYLFSCADKNLKPPLRDLLRTCWADAPAHIVEKLAGEATAPGRGARAPCIPVLLTATLASTRRSSGLGLGKLVLSYDPDFSNFIVSG